MGLEQGGRPGPVRGAQSRVDKGADVLLHAGTELPVGVRVAIETMAVVGAGQMGSGIAQVAAQAGLKVILADASPELARKAHDKLAAGLGRLVEKGKLQAAEREAVLARIRPAAGLDDCAPADLAVEAIVENLQVKAEVFKRTGCCAPRRCWPPTPAPSPSPRWPRRPGGPPSSSACTS
jgi:hypothetical protein